MDERLKFYENFIHKCDDEINAINNEIQMMDKEQPTDQHIIDMFAMRKSKLQNDLDDKKIRKETYMKLHEEEVVANARIFTEEQQMVVNKIGPKYKYHMNALKKMNEEKKKEFFNLYALSETDIQKNCIIKCFFNL